MLIYRYYKYLLSNNLKNALEEENIAQYLKDLDKFETTIIMISRRSLEVAFLKAYTSRGEKRRTVSSLRSSSVYSRRPSSILSRKSSNRSGTMAGFANDWNPSIAGPTRTRAPISAASTPAGQGADAAASHREIPLMVSPNASASESTDEDTTTARQRPQHPTIFTNATKEKIREQMRVE
jgi:hypothetical protein